MTAANGEAQRFALELIAAGLRSNDRGLVVEAQGPRSWLRPVDTTAYVDVRQADVQPDGRLHVVAFVTRLAGSEPLGIDVPQVHQAAMPVGSTSYRNAIPLRAYLDGAVLWRWTVSPGQGHPARSRVQAEGYLPTAQVEFPDDGQRQVSLAAALLDIAAQHPLPAETPEEKVFHGASYSANVKAVAADKYDVWVYAEDRPSRVIAGGINGQAMGNAPGRCYASSAESAEWLAGWVNRLVVPDCGILSGIGINGQAITLSFSRPNNEEL